MNQVKQFYNNEGPSYTVPQQETAESRSRNNRLGTPNIRLNVKHEGGTLVPGVRVSSPYRN